MTPGDDTRRSEKGPLSFDALLDEVTRKAGVSKSKPVPKAFAAWDAVAGPDLCEVARPVRFRAGELSIDVSSASHYHELVAFHAESLRARVNQHLGEEAVRRLSFRHQATP